MTGFDLERLRAREPAAMEEFANKAMATVNAAVRPFARDDDAEDMAQGAWLRIIEKLPRLVRDDNIAGWCATVAKNYCKSVLRARATEPELLDMEQLDQLVVERPPPDNALQRREARRATGAGLALLPKQERRAVRLRILQGRTSTQTAKTLRVAVPTARALVRRGLQMLRGQERLAAAHAALAGRSDPHVQDDLPESTLRRSVIAFLASSRHRREARFAIASGEDVFGAMVFADSLKTVERLSRRHPGSLVLVDSGEQLTEASERRKDIAIVQWRRAYKNADVLLPALVRAIVAKPVAALVSRIHGQSHPRACQIMTCVLSHSWQPYQASALAADLHLHPRTLGRLCARLHVPSPKKLISMSRIFMTECVIDWSNQPASRVAVVLGFSDASSYRRLVKTTLGKPYSALQGRGGAGYVATSIAMALGAEGRNES